MSNRPVVNLREVFDECERALHDGRTVRVACPNEDVAKLFGFWVVKQRMQTPAILPGEVVPYIAEIMPEKLVQDVTDPPVAL